VLSSAQKINRQQARIRWESGFCSTYSRQCRWLVTAASALAAAAITPATTVSAPSVTSTTTAAAATWRPLLAWTRFIHSHRSAIHSVTIELRDGILRFIVGAHGYKGEPT
jgi:hypothetical protein